MPNKPTLIVDQFPDGTFECPFLASEGGEIIGLATVTFKDGLWDAMITMDTEAAKKLGLKLVFNQTSHPDPVLGICSTVFVDRNLDSELHEKYFSTEEIVDPLAEAMQEVTKRIADENRKKR
jgi:hypothetical protein